MIEVIFSVSAGGNLKIAQRYGEGKYPGGCMSVFWGHEDGSEPTEEELENTNRKRWGWRFL